MKKKLSVIGIALFLAVLLSMPAMAASVCKIGSKGYPSLQAAVDAVKDGQTIKVTKAIKATSRVELPQRGLKYTIDFVKKKYMYTGDDYAFGISPGNSITVKNLNLKGSKMFAVGGNLTISSGKATCEQLAWTDGNTKSKLTIKGGTYTHSDALDLVYINNNGTLTIAKGTFKKGSMANFGKMTISGGSFHGGGANAIIANSGTLTISDGKFETGAETARCVNNNKTLTIKGGTFTAKDAVINVNEKTTATITGGVFARSSAPSLLVRGTCKVKGGTFGGTIVAEGGKVSITGGNSSGTVNCQDDGKVTISRFTIDQGATPHVLTPLGLYSPCLVNHGGTFLVKGGSYISPNGYGYHGNITFKVSGDYKKLFAVKTLIQN